MVVTIKSYSVKNGDMFYINHNNDTLTIIDCNLIDEKRDELLLELMMKINLTGLYQHIPTKII